MVLAVTTMVVGVHARASHAGQAVTIHKQTLCVSVSAVPGGLHDEERGYRGLR